MNSKIFVITHKKINVSLPTEYIPIQVGNGELIDKEYIRDNIGESISFKNPNYCELTGLYWIWKNYDLPEYIGISHYRRYFKRGIFKTKYISNNDIEKKMKKYDIILPKKFFFKVNIWDNYYRYGSGKEKDLITLKKIITEQYPEYINEFQDVMNSKSAYYCNMFIMKKNDYCNYCQWLFDILQKVEDEVDLSLYSKQEARIYGYLSELLINVWIQHKAMRVKEYSMIKIDDSRYKRMKSTINTLLIKFYNIFHF